MKELVIDRLRWARGFRTYEYGDEEGEHRTNYLYDPSDRKMCCIGIYLRSCGVQAKRLSDRLLPTGVPGSLPRQAQWLISPHVDRCKLHTNSGSCETLAQINDMCGPSVTEEEREKEIVEEFAKHDVRVTFIN